MQARAARMLSTTTTSAPAGKFASLFAQQAAEYNAFRPTYPQEMYNAIASYAGGSTRPGARALDIGCGSGQATVVLSTMFHTVVGVDPSAAQLSKAPQRPNVCYLQGAAEDIVRVVADSNAGGGGAAAVGTAATADSGGFDLINVAQALHWMDVSVFYPQAHSLLAPGGVLAISGYDNARILSRCTTATAEEEEEEGRAAAASAALQDMYTKRLGPWWDRNRYKLDNHLAGLEPWVVCPTLFTRGVRWPVINMVKQLSLAHIQGYVRSWSAYATFRKLQASALAASASATAATPATAVAAEAVPFDVNSDIDPAAFFLQQLCDVYGSGPDTVVPVSWPLFLLLSTRTVLRTDAAAEGADR